MFNTAPSWYVLPLPDTQLEATVDLETAEMGKFYRIFPYCSSTQVLPIAPEPYLLGPA